ACFDRREVDGANVDADHREHRDREQPAEHRLGFRGAPVAGVHERSGGHSSSVKGKAIVQATTNTRSYATSSLTSPETSATGRPASTRFVACAALMSTGTKNGRLSIGRSSSARRVFTAMALNSVPTATIPMMANSTTASAVSSEPPVCTL